MSLEETLKIGRQIIEARRLNPPVQWKVLCRKYGIQRTRLFELHQMALRAETADRMTVSDVSDLVSSVKDSLALLDCWVKKQN